MVKSFLLATTMAIGLVGVAMAADLPSPVVAPAPYLSPVSAFSWTGFYVGVNAGYVWADPTFAMTPFGLWNTAFDQNEAPFIARQGSPELHSSGFTGGGQFGYNLQSGGLVYGLEGDFEYTDINTSRHTGILASPAPCPCANFVFNETATSHWLATVRPRIGVAVDRALFYITGGLAFANYTFSSGYIYNPSPGLVSQGQLSETRVGWALGDGVEYAFTNNWTVKGEYLHADLGSGKSFQTAESGGVPGPNTYSAAHRSHLTENILRVGFNYKF